MLRVVTFLSLSRAFVFGLFLFLAACSTPHDNNDAIAPSVQTGHSRDLPRPQILTLERSLQCVPHARKISGIALRGDAWAWWKAAKGTYKRGPKPKKGSVLVLQRTDRLKYGHIAVVTHVLGPRDILVEHANWLNKGRVHKYQRVKDVSQAGDWSKVRLWYTPGNLLGMRTYPASGFVHAQKSARASRADLPA
jgi:CHAP domain-containing protein